MFAREDAPGGLASLKAGHRKPQSHGVDMPLLVLQTSVWPRIDCAKIAFVSGAEPQAVIFGVVREARIQPVDADPRLVEILLTTGLVEVRCNAGKFSRDRLLGSLGERFRPLVEGLRDGETIILVGRGLIGCNGRFWLLFRCRGSARFRRDRPVFAGPVPRGIRFRGNHAQWGHGGHKAQRGRDPRSSQHGGLLMPHALRDFSRWFPFRRARRGCLSPADGAKGGFGHGRTTNHLTRHVCIDLMPQSRHKKERFSPKGDECEPQRIEKSPRQIGRFPCQEFSQEEAGPHPAADRFQVFWLVWESRSVGRDQRQGVLAADDRLKVTRRLLSEPAHLFDVLA